MQDFTQVTIGAVAATHTSTMARIVPNSLAPCAEALAAITLPSQNTSYWSAAF